MFSRRFLPLMSRQMNLAVSTASSCDEVGEVTEEAVGILEDRVAQLHEPLHVPLLDVRFVGVDVDAEVEVVADELGRRLRRADPPAAR